MKRIVFFIILVLMILPFGVTSSQPPFATVPAWKSTDTVGYSRGAAWADINRDGWPISVGCTP